MAELDPLDNEPFSYRQTKDGRVRIAHHGKVVTTLVGTLARKFVARIAIADQREAQLAMAKATGHFKHGNERQDGDRG